MPEEYSTIQSAINAASEGDSVLVSDGTYSPSTNGANFPIEMKSHIALIGEGEELTILDAEGTDRVIILENCENNIISDITIIGGNTEGSGGGILLRNSHPMLTNVTISGNMSYGDGGGMYLEYSNPILHHITISSNSVIGGAINWGGGMSLIISHPILTNVTISGNNTQGRGGGMNLDFSNPILTNVTITGNIAGYGGGGMSSYTSNFTLTNSIIWENEPESIMFSGNSQNLITYNDIEGGWEGEGNIDADPQFRDPENGDFTLQPTSPCIDAGDPASELDPDSTIADMGAYYFDQIENPIIYGCMDAEAINYNADATVDDGSCFYCNSGDVNCDGVLNVLDIVLAANMVLADEYDEIADVNEDGELNILDLVIMVNLVLGGDAGACVDIDGNVYETVQIGDQLWMAENLKVTHYNDGGEIPNITNNGDWVGLSTGAYCDYDNNPTNSETYGRLYNWYTVDDSRGLCMEGWHVPSDEEYTILTDYLGGESVAGGKMKSTGTIEDGDGLWNYYSDEITEEATNESGFTALPAGYRYSSNGSYYNMGLVGYFWSSSEFDSNYARDRVLSYYYSDVGRDASSKRFGFSVRCLGD